jgi:hypothetical protein
MPKSNQLRATCHTDSLHTADLQSTGASHYHNCFVDGVTSLEYFGYTLVYICIVMTSVIQERGCVCFVAVSTSLEYPVNGYMEINKITITSTTLLNR